MFHDENTPRFTPRTRRVLSACAVIAALAWSAHEASAATYYVDPASGNDANAGTSTGSPWKTPPGTRNTGNTGYLRTSWGSISATQKLACGDKVILKAGATQTSAQGGAWLIDSTYYSDCNAAAPITIKVSTSAEWSGSSGPFTLDGAGVTPTAHPIKGFPDHLALISVAERGYIHIRGVDPSRRLVVTNSSKWSINVHCNGCTKAGFRGDWWELKNGGDGGFNIGFYTDWQVSNSIGHDLARGAWQVGLNADDHVERGAFVDVEAYRNGSATQLTWADDAFFFVGGKSQWCVRCTAHHNNQRGFNTGVIADAANVEFNYRFRSVVAYDNGLACSLTAPTLYCIGAGLYVSGNEGAAPANSNNTVVGGIFFHNADLGFGSYGQASIEVWNATTYRTNYKRAGMASVLWDTTAKQMRIFNSVDARATGYSTFARNTSNAALPQLNLPPATGNNCFAPISSDTETLGIGGGGTLPPAGTYGAPPSWIGSTNLSGTTKCRPAFTAVHDTDYSRVDFTPTTDSTLVNGGRFLMRASAPGTNATTIAVKANGGASDPRQFFIAADSYLDPLVTDRAVQIEGCGVRTIDSMTANSITFSPACSWSTDAGVSLPWSGSAPDIGAIESGLSLRAPVLLSVDPSN